eukprot:GHVU01161050.1.p1 GENE.GHVU01161050.1~~GHVU01161050.1.p1  ORF type:complete len:442 (+),score=90.52 GHVU01161050.1:268-1593(+)
MRGECTQSNGSSAAKNKASPDAGEASPSKKNKLKRSSSACHMGGVAATRADVESTSSCTAGHKTPPARKRRKSGKKPTLPPPSPVIGHPPPTPNASLEWTHPIEMPMPKCRYRDGDNVKVQENPHFFALIHAMMSFPDTLAVASVSLSSLISGFRQRQLAESVQRVCFRLLVLLGKRCSPSANLARLISRCVIDNSIDAFYLFHECGSGSATADVVKDSNPGDGGGGDSGSMTTAAGSRTTTAATAGASSSSGNGICGHGTDPEAAAAPSGGAASGRPLASSGSAASRVPCDVVKREGAEDSRIASEGGGELDGGAAGGGGVEAGSAGPSVAAAAAGSASEADGPVPSDSPAAACRSPPRKKLKREEADPSSSPPPPTTIAHQEDETPGCTPNDPTNDVDCSRGGGGASAAAEVDDSDDVEGGGGGGGGRRGEWGRVARLV